MTAKLAVLILVLFTSSCADLIRTSAPYATPAITLELCDAVDYQRKGLDVSITAKCKAPTK